MMGGDVIGVIGAVRGWGRKSDACAKGRGGAQHVKITWEYSNISKYIPTTSTKSTKISTQNYTTVYSKRMNLART